MIHPAYFDRQRAQDALLARKNSAADTGAGLLQRYRYPVLTAAHIPLTWTHDLRRETNPHFLQRLGVNAVFNAGAILLDGRYLLAARVEGYDRKSFFAVAESSTGVDGFRFWDYPLALPDTCPEETNVYDLRLTRHEDGYIYGVFCSESKDPANPDLASAIAQAGIVRTKDLQSWERLPNLQTLRSSQQRNVVLHPEFVDGRYAFYTRPMDDFIDTGSGGGIGFGLVQRIENPVLDSETIVSPRRYHAITEAKNGAGAVPIKTDRGWIHIAHGVRQTAAGLRYVLYAFATSLEKPWQLTAEPGGYLLAPQEEEYVGDVSNVVFSNGAIVHPDGNLYLYYASSDTRLHVATCTLEQLVDYVFETPPDARRSADCVKQRSALIQRNRQLLDTQREGSRA